MRSPQATSDHQPDERADRLRLPTAQPPEQTQLCGVEIIEPGRIAIGEASDEMIVVHILVDCRDAMGANLINSVAERVADRLAALADGRVGLRILSNLCDKRCVRVKCRVPASVQAYSKPSSR